jgi:hypothetical protein
MGGSALRRYIVTLVLMAVLIGSLFRASEQTGVRLMNMFATLGIFLFGVVGTMALTRWQSREGIKEIQTALKSLEPHWLVTDWLARGGEYPDYLLVGPGGIAAVCLDETPQSAGKRKAQANLQRSRERATAAVRHVYGRLNMPDLPVAAVVVLNRRKAEPAYAADGISVVNAGELAGHIRRLWGDEPLDERARVKLTRALRAE